MRWQVLCITLVLVGCAVGPDYQRPKVEVPIHFGLMESWLDTSAPKAAWWRTFNDTKLNLLVEQALKQNLDVVEAWAKVRQADAVRVAVTGGNWPQASLSAQVTRDRFSTLSEQYANIPFPNLQNQFTDNRVGVSASWELDLFGYTARSIEAAAARAESAVEIAHAVALATIAEVTRSYLDLRTLQQREIIAQRVITLAAEAWRLTKLQHQAGLIDQSVINQAETTLRNAQAQLLPIQAGMRADLGMLAVLTGNLPHAFDNLLGDEQSLPEPKGIVGIGLPSDLLLRRPDIRRAERELAAANADVGVATAAQYPRFTLIGSFGMDSIYRGQLTNQAAHFWSVGPTLSLPVFTGGTLASQVKANQAAYEAALASYRKTILQALADTETALMRYDRENVRLHTISATRDLADHSLKLMQQRANVGEVATLDTLLSDMQLQQATDAWLVAHLVRSLALVDVYQALGGGW